MDVPLSKQFVLWRGDKRFVVGESKKTSKPQRFRQFSR